MYENELHDKKNSPVLKQRRVLLFSWFVSTDLLQLARFGRLTSSCLLWG
jgi:hypothetical protein